MYYTGSVMCYDCLGSVRVCWDVQQWEPDESGKPTATKLISRYIDVPGVGEADPTLWLRDALVAALEQL